MNKKLLLVYFWATLATTSTVFLINRAVAQISPLQIQIIIEAANAYSKIRGNSTSSNFEQLISSINCRQVSCSPKTICQYLSIGSVFPMNCQGLDSTPFQISQDELLLIDFIQKLPPPDVCSKFVPDAPGRLILDPIGIENSNKVLTQCSSAVTVRNSYIYQHQEEILSLIKKSSRISTCSPTFSPTAFQGRTGKVAFYNEWNAPVTVILYHPNSRSVYDRYTVSPGQNQFLGNNIIVGDDWGVCFENKPGASGFVNNLGSISIYNPNSQGSPLFMIQNDRIK